MPASDGESPPPASKEAARVGPNTAGTVLVIEDQEALRDLMETLLRKAGHNVFCTDSGHEAYAYTLSHQDVSLALVNLKMPAMSGVEFMKKLQELPDRIRPKVIVVTGNITTPTDDGYDELGVTAVIRKPFDNKTFINYVNAVLAVDRLARHQE